MHIPSPMPSVLRLLLVGLFALISGCAATVKTDINSFHTPDFSRGKVALAVIPADRQFENSLEFNHYRAKLEKRLEAQGFTIVASEKDARYLAMLGYHISDGEVEVTSSPVVGQVGYDPVSYASVIHHADGSASYVRQTHWVPSFGIVGSTTQAYTRFTTLVTLDIVDNAQISDGEPAKVFELKARSTGSCGIVSRIFDEMLEAIFSDFPGENNRVARVSVKADMSCY